ncbi:MAG: 3-dehydroquinate synthase [Cyclobacteriaceae bacterium]|nr:MAG: 3-dehydroquinate synthase [Cyclobacteriaceae bacterium]
MNFLQQSFSVPYQYKVFFTQGLFDVQNETLLQTIDNRLGPQKVLFVFDQGVIDHHPTLITDIRNFVQYHSKSILELGKHIIIPGGEQSKNHYTYVDTLIQAVNDLEIDRHSYIVAIGGGSVLDAVGFAAAVSHRGIRLIRVPTTVLSQNDSGVGVKNGVNAFSKKNFIGTFAPPTAVINDKDFLYTLEARDWRSGIAEGIKVGLIKDLEFFKFIEASAEKLTNRDMEVMEHLIYRCAELHLEHIASGDAFEMGSSRPLDFGHWSAHKLEQITGYEIRHGEAVALGMALDAIYSCLDGRLDKPQLQRILDLMVSLRFDMFHTGLNSPELIDGLKEFQEHLGGQLTVMLLEEIGKGIEVHKIDHSLVLKSVKLLQEYHENQCLNL